MPVTSEWKKRVMKKVSLIVAAVALLSIAAVPSEQTMARGFGGGGFHGGGFHGFGGGGFHGFGGGGFRGLGGGFRGAALGPRASFAAVGPGFRGGAIGRGFVGGGRWAGARWGGARWAGAGWRGGRRWGWRRGWGWPVALGIGLGAWSYYDSPYYSDSCLAWNGYQWVNVCYGYY